MGATLPIAGAGARRVRDAVLRNSVDRAMERAGSHAVETLDAARRAARAGNQDEARRLMNQLEEHLTPDQVRVLRTELNLDVPGSVHPPQAVEPPDTRQTRLLEESRAVASGVDLTQEQLENELAIVRRSQPQPSHESGYVDEVDLGNNHVWRRKADDGTWCRFSGVKSLCGTHIPGAMPPGPPPAWATELLNPRSAYYNPQAVARINRLIERVRGLGIEVDMNEVAAALTQFRGRGRSATRINEALDVIEAEFDRLANSQGAPSTIEDLRPHLPGADADDAAVQALEEAVGVQEGLSFGGRPVVHTGIGDEIQTLRNVLRNRMLDAGMAPSWAPSGREWNAHHLIPWERQHHSVFDVLRANGGWDHNALANGIGLPTRPGIAGAEHLPVHQLPGPGRGHPVYNDYVKGRLDDLMGRFGNDPAELRRQTNLLLEDLRGQLEAGGYRGYVF
ncbi:MAG: AHH domain-containing protein [Ardenticatenaceae bacterium]|nr:AHH domain-containing protein [Ardenticatenaceae bacterium]